MKEEIGACYLCGAVGGVLVDDETREICPECFIIEGGLEDED